MPGRTTYSLGSSFEFLAMQQSGILFAAPIGRFKDDSVFLSGILAALLTPLSRPVTPGVDHGLRRDYESGSRTTA
jgi:hypothetical protein